MKRIGWLLAAALFSASGVAQAETVQCKGLTFKAVTVEGVRDDGFEFQNKLIVVLNGQCGGKTYMHAGLNHPAFDGFLAIALAVKEGKKTVNIAVNTSKQTERSNQIAYIELGD
ncbi:MAG: hypothetical protein COX57_09235 [Alphaproteobacteria bacterium CG_4_10_14_0_2_um_filter_63_37]|nr:MAG: hypothetical protein AUJ55_09140 [Proteobacteria bacterium CG1_02_64_396]PJA24328.1 MAG: hypothetical protein COX57_09235 [Alphaproteobacteria bacterium CG_4_10_14_0_2_um_filter_63_37]